MKVTEHLEMATEPLISFEIVPPSRGGSLPKLLHLIEELAQHRPRFIDITSHAAEVISGDLPGGGHRRLMRKRPGTLGICALVQNKYDIDAVPHILCEGFTREETEDFLIELHYLGIDNVLAVRGDPASERRQLDSGRSRNDHASDLVQQIVHMNAGGYLEELEDASPTRFCVGVAGYPEKHSQAPSRSLDIEMVKRKVDAGAEYVVTQMFFENAHYFSFVEDCREQGIDVPIIPGLRILTNPRQLTSIPSAFHCEIPDALAAEIGSTPNHARDIGVAWASEQVGGLLESGVASVHFFVMSSAVPVHSVLKKLHL